MRVFASPAKNWHLILYHTLLKVYVNVEGNGTRASGT